jgi:hypothetical protein
LVVLAVAAQSLAFASMAGVMAGLGLIGVAVMVKNGVLAFVALLVLGVSLLVLNFVRRLGLWWLIAGIAILVVASRVLPR